MPPAIASAYELELEWIPLIKAFLALSLGNFAIALGAYLIVGLLVPLARDLKVGDAESGLMMVIYAGAYAVSSPVLVNLSSMWPRRATLLASLACFAGGICLTALAGEWTLALVGRAVSAMGAGLYTPTAASTVYTLSPPKRRGRNLSIVFFGILFAQAVGMPAGMLLEARFGWKAALLSVVAVVVAASMAIIATLPSRVGPPRPPASPWLLVGNRTALLGLALTIAHLLAYSAVYTFIGPITVSYGQVDAFGVLLTMGVAGAFGSIAVGLLADRVTPRTLLLVVMSVEALALPLFSWSGAPAALVLGIAGLWAMASAAFMVPQQVRLVRQAPDHQSLVLALNATATYAGFALGSGIGSIVAGVIGLQGLGVTGGLLALIGLALLLRLPESQQAPFVDCARVRSKACSDPYAG